jgi:Na+/H+ antiporter NhaC
MNKILDRIIWLILLIPVIYLAMAWQKTPAIIPTHFGLDNVPDKYGSKNELITMSVIFTLLGAAIYLFISNVYRFDPLRL